MLASTCAGEGERSSANKAKEHEKILEGVEADRISSIGSHQIPTSLRSILPQLPSVAERLLSQAFAC